MQQVQQREGGERISWARAMIFAIGFFFIAAILIGQLPSYVFIQVTASSLQGFETGTFSLGLVCMAGFAVIQVIMLLFDPKPLVPPGILTVIGWVLAVVGLAITILATTTGCTPTNHACNQYFPTAGTVWNPLLGGKVLWFQPGAVDFVVVGLTLLTVGVAMVFYSTLAKQELRNPDRRDLGTTPAIRWMIVGSVMLLILFMVFYTYTTDSGLGAQLAPDRPFFGQKLVDLFVGMILGAAILLAAGAFALRLHYLMRPVRKRTMAGLYAIGALGLAQLGVILLLAWFIVYPLIAWMHTWTFIGLGSFLTTCSKSYDIPGSCSFSQDAGYLVDTIVTMGFFTALMAAVWAWKSNRNLVVIGSVVITAVIAFSALLVHTAPDTAGVPSGQFFVGMMLCVAILVLASIWTAVSRREFAVVGENNLGCLGMWLVFGTCLFVYIAAFGFFSIPGFPDETEPNIPFAPGGGLGGYNAVVILLILGVLAAIQFYFLTRNRYKV